MVIADEPDKASIVPHHPTQIYTVSTASEQPFPDSGMATPTNDRCTHRTKRALPSYGVLYGVATTDVYEGVYATDRTKCHNRGRKGVYLALITFCI